jgi:VanZ family protein
MFDKKIFWTLKTSNNISRLLLHHLPAIAYAALIYYVSSMTHANPPSLGLSWEDKIYHCGEYALFSFFTFIALKYYSAGWVKKHVFLLAALIACLFAATDEFHQMYVPGRNATLSDMFSDWFGAIMALLAIRVFLKLKRPKRD